MNTFVTDVPFILQCIGVNNLYYRKLKILSYNPNLLEIYLAANADITLRDAPPIVDAMFLTSFQTLLSLILSKNLCPSYVKLPGKIIMGELLAHLTLPVINFASFNFSTVYATFYLL